MRWARWWPGCGPRRHGRDFWGTRRAIPRLALSAVNRCFQIMTERAESQWRNSNLVIQPDVKGIGAARAALPTIRKWFMEPETIAAA